MQQATSGGKPSEGLYLDFGRAGPIISFFISSGNLVSLVVVKAYLSNRVQYVSVGQSTSTSLPVISGVPTRKCYWSCDLPSIIRC